MIKHCITDYFIKGHQRSRSVKKNIIALLVIKGISIIINLALVPLTLKFVNAGQYGIWLTLSSIIAWFSVCDLGFGNGLRNRFVEAKATEDFEKARVLVSTTYAALIIIFSFVWLVFFIINFYLDWSKILNIPPEMGTEISTLALIILSFFCLQTVLQTISTVVIADQQPYKAAFFDMLGQLFALILLYILTKKITGSLIYLAMAMGVAPLSLLIVASIWFYSKQYRNVTPSIAYVKYSNVKDIMRLGVKFFLIQISVIVLYQTNNIIISQIGKPEDVTVYNIAYKYLGVSISLFAIIISPFWSAFTEAYTKNDYIWMNTTVKKLRIISCLFVVFVFILVSISNYIYQMWIGDLVTVPFAVSLSIGVYCILLNIVSLSTQILNGMGKIKIQLLTYSLAAVFHVPLAIMLGKRIGIAGVILSASIFYSIISIFSIIQVNKLIDNKASGVWNR